MGIVAMAVSVHLQTVFYMISFHTHAMLFNTQKLCILPYTQNKQLSFPWTVLNSWFLKWSGNVYNVKQKINFN